jgi:hypothetical protein
MFDKRPYLQTICHAADEEGETESSHLKAFKIDDKDGLSKALGFHDGMFKKVDYFVDYFLENQCIVQLIELSDLEETAQYYKIFIKDGYAALKQNAPERVISDEEEKAIQKEAVAVVWAIQKDELFKKWSGSIAVIERLYRKTQELGDADPTYRLLVVCKNHTDVKMLDPLRRQLSGMMGNVKVCDTKTLEDCLIKLE